MTHPYIEEARLIEDVLKLQRRHDRAPGGGTGVILPLVQRYIREYGDIDSAIDNMRARIRELRHLASIDEEWKED